ncbi:MAG: response regulator transcription factor [Chloroflexi bacterium]|nr:response regulator transcription factor [Chloroflexota bacterium]MCL5274816.1 response regulator transcription factor [Chloroflexota bacterium]
MANVKILIVDDEPSITATVRAYLEKEGFTVFSVIDGPAALKAARTLKPDLIVLDVMLPGMDGFEVLQQLRRESDVYVLMLTARSGETDKIVGLSVGADDYLTKPFSPRELVARIKAVLRRNRAGGEAALAFRRLRIDIAARRVWKDDAELDLTSIEFDMLAALARHYGRVLGRDQLIEQVWGNDYYGDERVVDVHLGRLRRKIEDDPANPALIATVRGAGYRFEDEPL